MFKFYGKHIHNLARGFSLVAQALEAIATDIEDNNITIEEITYAKQSGLIYQGEHKPAGYR